MAKAPDLETMDMAELEALEAKIAARKRALAEAELPALRARIRELELLAGLRKPRGRRKKGTDG